MLAVKIRKVLLVKIANDALISVIGVAEGVSVVASKVLLFDKEDSGTVFLLEKKINPKRDVRIIITTMPTTLLMP